MKTLMSWSSGKDSAWALHQMRRDARFDVAGLFCTVNQAFGRVAMHGVRVELLQAQAKAAGLPLEIIPIPWPCSNLEYEIIMRGFVARAQAQQVQAFGFGDLFLADIRAYREQQLAGTGIEAVFPLWGQETGALIAGMLAGGLRAVITCVDPKQAPGTLAGKEITPELIAALPASVDPCGENGEFHSFVFDGPMFANPVPVKAGEVLERDGFVFADLLPAVLSTELATGLPATLPAED